MFLKWHRIIGAALFIVAAALPFIASAQDVTPEAGANAESILSSPGVVIGDQYVVNGMVRVEQVYSESPGYIVVHVDAEGAPGAVAGFRWLSPGINTDVLVPIDPTIATPTMYAMLHIDDGAIGVYEFDGQSGLDAPVSDDVGAIAPAYVAYVIAMNDQMIAGDNTFTAQSVTIDAPGWLAIHTDNAGVSGDILGYAPLSAGTNIDVVVPLEAPYNNFAVWPQLYYDTGESGIFEFDTVAGVDGPITLDEQPVTVQVLTIPNIRAYPQIVIPGDNVPDIAGMVMTPAQPPVFIVDSVVAEADGWIAVHIDNAGAPGAVVGYAPVTAGSNRHILVTLDGAETLTARLWLMLHGDDGAIGTFEYDGTNGLDNPAFAMGVVVVHLVAAAPMIDFDDQPLENSTIRIDSVLIDAPGWLAIHANADGQPGAVLGQIRVALGYSANIVIPLPADGGNLVFPMLHYDTGELGVYEFGTVEGADAPVLVNGAVVVAPLNITGSDAP